MRQLRDTIVPHTGEDGTCAALAAHKRLAWFDQERRLATFDADDSLRESARRPGDRVIRRRVRATRVIDLPESDEPVRAPTAVFHARLFIAIFALITLIGGLLLMLPWVTHSGEATAPVDALFTAMSALSVTGLVTRDTATHWNFFGELIILVLIQIGGLGFMVGTSLVLSLLGGGRLRHHLMIRENIPTLTLRETVSLTGRIARFTFIVEGVGAVLLTARYMEEYEPHRALWHGIFHSISAFCNAGFDLEGNFASLTGFQESVVVTLIFVTLIQLGAISYFALHDVYESRRWRDLTVNTRIIFVFNTFLVLGGMALFIGAEWNGVMADTDEWTRPVQALFQSVSGRTAGFTIVDFDSVSTFTKFSLIGLMFIGGASGSTAGGIKMGTVAIVLIAVFSQVRGDPEPQVYNRRLGVSLVLRAMTIVSLFFLLHFTITLALSGTEHLYGETPPFVDLLFETMSAQATNGLSTGITPSLSTPGKLIIIGAMFVGRLGPLTVAYALAQRQRAPRYRFPETTVHIG